MELSRESNRARWIGLIIMWLVAAGLLVGHAELFRRNLGLADRVGLRGAEQSPTPMKRIAPTMYADALVWVRHSLRIAEGESLRVRETKIDNAPFGREVHWNSGFSWLIVGAAKLQQAFTGEALPQAMERSMAWFNVPLLLGFVVLLSWWASARAGLAAGVVLGLAMLGNNTFYGGFGPNYVDHHGLMAVSVLGLVLGAVFMGAGYWKTPQSSAQLLPSSFELARRGALVSAVAGGLGLWVSAATLVPAIAVTGLMGVVVTLAHGRRAVATGVHAAPGLWRLWGRTGGLLSLALYVLEYAPSHFGLRLEVNHPVYALGWWAGSEIIAQVIEAWLGLKRGVQWRRLGPALAGLALAPLVVLIAGRDVFVVFDRFVGGLARHVAEGISLPTALRIFPPRLYLWEFVWMGGSLLAGAIAWWRSAAADRIVVGFAGLAAAAFTTMAVSQLRWGPSASGPLIILAMLAVGCIAARRVRLRYAAAGLVVLLSLTVAGERLVRLQDANRRRAVDKPDAIQPVYRDIAAALRASQPEGNIVVLASPNASVAISYYGQFQAIGTLYWENVDGMKAAAAMLSAQTEQEARRLIRERGVTHVALVSDDNFIAEYFNLLYPEPGAKTVPQSFGYRTLINLISPLWLEQIPYELPTDLPYRPDRVLLFRTRFSGVPEADALYENALDASAAGRTEEVEAAIDRALQLAPRHSEFWVAKTNLLLSRGEMEPAMRAVEQAVATATPGQRATVCRAEAARFYQRRAHAAAAQLYRAALETSRDVATLNNLAWILATTPDDAVRNGREALEITSQVVAQQRELVVLNSHAAALAETGHYDAAVSFAVEALELSRQTKDQDLVALAEARLARYRAAQPWRE